MATISATIITKNEEQNIGRCLESVAWCDEIIVVDQFSNDKTADIVRQTGAQVYQESWKGYAAQKNSAIAKAAGDWIFSIDADERVPPALKREIKKILADNNSEYNGFYIARKNFFTGKWIRHSGWFPDYNLRLFRRNKGKFPERTVHEHIVLEGKASYLVNALEHKTYRSVADFLARLDTYSGLAADEIRNKPRWTRYHNLTLRPFFTFFSMYILQKGILDGQRGFFLAVSYAYYTFLKYYRYYYEDSGNSLR